MTFLGPYDGKQSLYGEILDVFCKKSEHWLPTGVMVANVDLPTDRVPTANVYPFDIKSVQVE